MKSMRILTVLLAFVALAGLGRWAVAARTKLSDRDQKFVEAAASSALGEYKINEMAEDQAASDDVKKLAKNLQPEHVKINKQCIAILNKKGIPSPDAMNDQDQKAVDQLSTRKGDDFDRAFLQVQLDGHKRAIALFEDEAAHGDDPDLKAFAEKTLPTLRGFLKEITAQAGGERPAK